MALSKKKVLENTLFHEKGGPFSSKAEKGEVGTHTMFHAELDPISEERKTFPSYLEKGSQKIIFKMFLSIICCLLLDKKYYQTVRTLE
jgi:hypothetical protein